MGRGTNPGNSDILYGKLGRIYGQSTDCADIDTEVLAAVSIMQSERSGTPVRLKAISEQMSLPASTIAGPIGRLRIAGYLQHHKVPLVTSDGVRKTMDAFSLSESAIELLEQKQPVAY